MYLHKEREGSNSILKKKCEEFLNPRDLRVTFSRLTLPLDGEYFASIDTNHEQFLKREATSGDGMLGCALERRRPPHLIPPPGTPLRLRILFDGRVDEAREAQIEIDVSRLYGVPEAVIGELMSRAYEPFIVAQRLIEHLERCAIARGGTE